MEWVKTRSLYDTDAAPVGIVCPLCLSELWPSVSVNIERALVHLPVQLVKKNQRSLSKC